MAVTIKMISEISGVSRGTVDRVLNGRGKVSPQTEAHVRRVAEQLGYKPNLAGKTLAVMKKTTVIGVLLTAEGIPFFDEVIRGVRAAEVELAEYGVVVRLRTIKGYDPAVQLRALEEMGGCNALILNPINDHAVERALAAAAAGGTAVVTVNTDLSGDWRLCHVGPDYRKSGETAAGLLTLLLPGEHRKLLVFSGSRKIAGHRQRVDGFADVLRTRRPGWRIADVLYTNDDDIIAYETAIRAFRDHPDTGGVYIAAAGTYGVGRAVMAVFPGDRPILICSDNIPTTTDMLRGGVVQAAICQEPYRQGYEAVRRAFDYLVSAAPPHSLTVKCEILIRENAE